MIDVENRYRGAPNRRSSAQQRPAPGEMLFPDIKTWIEQSR
jgi:hypothetical protein